MIIFLSALRHEPPRFLPELADASKVCVFVLALALVTGCEGHARRPRAGLDSDQISTPAARIPAATTRSQESATSSAALDSPWRLALPGYRFVFPRDHASHPGFKTEWWYYTGHLRTRQGRSFGFELTFFRFGVRPPGSGGRSAWTLRDVYAAHFAITDESRGGFFFSDRVSRGALGTAGAASDRYRVWVEDWSSSLQLNNSSTDPSSQPGTGSADDRSGDENTLPAAAGPMGSQRGVHVLKAMNGDYGLDLSLQSAKPAVIHGEKGVSQKSAGRGRASHYYSLTRLLGSGTLTTPEGRFTVDAVAWMDHEFGSNQLGADQVGWDWFSLQLKDGRELMLYQLRLRDGRLEPFSSGTLVERDGMARHLRLEEFEVEVLARWRSPKTGGLYPSRWRVRVPAAGLDLDIEPTVADQELVTSRSTGVAYWEGSVRVSGSHRGRGYVELTGYAERFAAPI